MAEVVPLPIFGLEVTAILVLLPVTLDAAKAWVAFTFIVWLPVVLYENAGATIN